MTIRKGEILKNLTTDEIDELQKNKYILDTSDNEKALALLNEKIPKSTSINEKGE